MSGNRLVPFGEISSGAFEDFILEWESEGQGISPAAIKRRGMNFSQLQERWRWDEGEEPAQKGFVPSTLYFFITKSSRILGALHFRHRLNEALRQHGGHVGYGIRTSSRNRGIGRQMLSQFLATLDPIKYPQIVLTCDATNEASIKIITNNGGRLEAEYQWEGTNALRFLIPVKDSILLK